MAATSCGVTAAMRASSFLSLTGSPSLRNSSYVSTQSLACEPSNSTTLRTFGMVSRTSTSLASWSRFCANTITESEWSTM